MKTKTTTKNQKIGKAARIGVKIDLWKLIATVSHKVNTYAVGKHDKCLGQQDRLLNEIMGKEVEPVPTVSNFKYAAKRIRAV